jgi:orotidine-5'-phosphate decarboxylase
MQQVLERPIGGQRIIVALDFPSIDKARPIAVALSSIGVIQKVGLQLITSSSPHEAVGLVHGNNGGAFYDGKFHDIPNTVGEASAAVAALNVAMFNVHASSGIEAMMAAVANRGQSLVLAVTVLTSLEENNAFNIFGAPSKAKVLQFARDAQTAGCQGIVCSPQELKLLKSQKDLSGLLYVTPGIRAKNAPDDDQHRTMTPAECVLAGGDYMVVGRPITKASDPVAAFMAIVDEIEEAEAEMAQKAVE